MLNVKFSVNLCPFSIDSCTDYGHTKAESLILCGPNSNPKYLGCGYKGLVFCRNNDWLIQNMDKELRVPEWVLIVWPKIPLMPQTLSAQFVCSSPKILDFNEKGFIKCP